jgi:DNA uptake protein ComE-like DNA-binding protein
VSDELDVRSLEDREARAYARWAAAPLFSVGFLAPVPFFVASSRTGDRRYLRAALFWTVMVIACIVALVIDHGREGATFTAIGGFLIFINMGGATAHTLWIRQRVARELAVQQDPQLTAAERRADTRSRARELARTDPKRALELGVGRPDVEGAFDAGLIDVNHAPPAVLERLPGIDAEHARRIVELRMNGSGFVSAEDLGMVLDLDPGAMEELASRAVFLPRY